MKSRFGAFLCAAIAMSVALSYPAAAQTAAPVPKIVFTAAVSSGTSTVTPVLSWTTTPVADLCTASGTTDWAGTKADHGTALLAAINASQTYSLTCVWKGGQATLSWDNATKNTDGTLYTDPAATRIIYGQVAPPPGATVPTADQLTKKLDFALPSPPLASRILTNLTPEGMWYFAVETVNAGGVASDPSNVIGKYVLASDINVSQTVGIVVYKQPAAPTNLAVR